MFARVSHYDSGGTRNLDNVRRVLEQISDQTRALPGFQKAYFLVDNASGKGLSITLWDSEASVQASAAGANPLRAQLAQAFGGTGQPAVETYEVVGEV